MTLIKQKSIHLLNQRIDLVLSVPQIPPLHKVFEFTRPEATGGAVQLKWPEEITSLLEIGADGVDFVDQILHADDTVLAQVGFDKLVVR